MNKERILAVADAIEKSSVPDLGFDMRKFAMRNGCRTVACIAGWAVSMFTHDGRARLERVAGLRANFSIGFEARLVLDLESEDAHELFYAEGTLPTEMMLADVTSEHAVAVLRRLAETGVVDWTPPE